MNEFKMREILFRGRTTYTKVWTEGGFHSRFERAFIIGISKELRIDGIEVDPETVGQFTGLYDKNGKMIFEGDIVEAKLANGNYQGFSWGLQTVSFKNGAFGLVNEKKEFTAFDNYNYNVEFEIMGNIHDESELLKEGI